MVHTHTWYVAMVSFLAKKLYNTPFVLTTHSLEPLRAWKAEQLGTGYAMSSGGTNRDSRSGSNHRGRAEQEDILRCYPVKEERIKVIYNGIDLDEYRKNNGQHRSPAAWILAVCAFCRPDHHQKGVTHLVDAIRYLAPNTQVVLCAGAPDTPEIAAEMRRMVDEGANLQSARHLDRGDARSRPEAVQFYSHARVFCCPSIYEPFGIINLEAMACETAVVASAIKEVVVDGNGISGALRPDPETFSPLDPDQFARSLAAKITDLIRRSRKPLCKRAGDALKRSSAGQRSPIKPSISTRNCWIR